MIKNLLALKPTVTFRNLDDVVAFLRDSKDESLFGKRLRCMQGPIFELHALIGQEALKDRLLNVICCAAQGQTNMMLNVCLYAPPGAGKTRLTRIIAELYYCSGVLFRQE